jgi:multiple antibiotic resistance protein
VSGQDIITFTAAMFAIANPIANLGIFAGMTGDYTSAQKTSTAWQTLVAVFITLLVVTWAGRFVLDLFGISVGMMQVAGGAVLAHVGWSMLYAKESRVRGTKEEAAERLQRGSIAIIPLTIPIVAGPGTMATVLTEVNQFTSTEDRLIITGVCVVIALLNYTAFRIADPASRELGQTGINVVTRVMGLVLLCIAVGILVSGLTALLPGLAKS